MDNRSGIGREVRLTGPMGENYNRLNRVTEALADLRVRLVGVGFGIPNVAKIRLVFAHAGGFNEV